MTSHFQALIAAIVDDDSAGSRNLLTSNPAMAASRFDADVLYDSKIAHWIYVGDTALHVAAAGYRVEIARLLLAASANVRSAENRRRSQPIHYAADGSLASPAWNAERQVAMIRLLLQAGADVNAADANGATPLHRAVRTRCAAAVHCLLEAGGDPTIRNKPGSTPFHLAVQNTGRGGSGAASAHIAQREIIHAFLACGVSPSLTDAQGKSVTDWARSNSIREMLAA